MDLKGEGNFGYLSLDCLNPGTKRHVVARVPSILDVRAFCAPAKTVPCRNSKYELASDTRACKYTHRPTDATHWPDASANGTHTGMRNSIRRCSPWVSMEMGGFRFTDINCLTRHHTSVALTRPKTFEKKKDPSASGRFMTKSHKLTGIPPVEMKRPAAPVRCASCQQRQRPFFAASKRAMRWEGRGSFRARRSWISQE